MVPPEYGNFLVASTGASAALLGLLFVSISIAPEKVFGTASEPSRRSLALASFTALANAFFISLSGLIPHLNFGDLVVITGLVAISQTLSLVTAISGWRASRNLLRGVTLFLAAITVYGYEIVMGIQIINQPNNPAAVTVILELLLAVFAIGLARAWELLGAPAGRGVIGDSILFVDRLLGRAGKPPETKPPQGR